jgi:hypothetical protein
MTDAAALTTAPRRFGRIIAGRWQELLAYGTLLAGVYVALSTAVMIGSPRRRFLGPAHQRPADHLVVVDLAA